MVSFTSSIKKFDQQGEKTGWTYIEISADTAEELKSNNRKTFRVKGNIDNCPISQLALLPMGNGSFILPLNAALRKMLHKKKGARVRVSLTEDRAAYVLSKDLMESFADAPLAAAKFNALPKSHQNYYSKWIETAKTVETKAKRIIMTISAMEKNLSYAEMLRSNRINSQTVNK